MAERATRPSTAHSARMYMTANAALISVLNSGKRHTCNNTQWHTMWASSGGRHNGCSMPDANAALLSALETGNHF
jgi:hypothetical protein